MKNRHSRASGVLFSPAIDSVLGLCWGHFLCTFPFPGRMLCSNVYFCQVIVYNICTGVLTLLLYPATLLYSLLLLATVQ